MDNPSVAPNTANFLRQGFYALSPVRRRSAQALVLLMPVVMAAEAWLTQESLLLVLLMVELALCASFAIRELARKSENARRNALAIALLNSLLLAVAGGLVGNILMILCAGLFALSAALLLLRFALSKRRLVSAWGLIGLALFLALGVPIYGRMQVEHAAGAWKEGRHEEGLEALERVDGLLWLKGVSPIEGALLRLRGAELAIRSEHYDRAAHFLDGLDAEALRLPAPIEAGESDARLRFTLAFVIFDKGVQKLKSRVYAHRRYGAAPPLPRQLLEEYRAYPSDEIGWAKGFLDQDAVD